MAEYNKAFVLCTLYYTNIGGITIFAFRPVLGRSVFFVYLYLYDMFKFGWHKTSHFVPK